MPIRREWPGPEGVIQTTLSGRVTDDELLAYYQDGFIATHQGRWRELVDGSRIEQMDITPNGQAQLAHFLATVADKLRGGKVAMVAASDLTFGMFRMWQLQRESLGYDVKVFRDPAEAMDWVMAA